VSETPRTSIAKAGAAAAVSTPDPGPAAPLAKARLEGFDRDPSTTINSVRAAEFCPATRPTIRPTFACTGRTLGTTIRAFCQ
jgi:hypothetical protein